MKRTISVLMLLCLLFGLLPTAAMAEETCMHTGGTATCQSPAICELCNTPYGDVDKNNHTGDQTLVSGNHDGTHTMHCSGCNTDYSQSCSGGTATCTSKAECQVCGEAYGDIQHSAGRAYDPIDDITHNIKCDTCGEILGTESCLFSTATCTTPATCKCGNTQGTVDAENHQGSTQCISNHNGTHSNVCESCSNPVGDPDACSGGTATCTKAAVCSLCGESYGDPLGHDRPDNGPCTRAACDCTQDHEAQRKDGKDVACKECGKILPMKSYTITYQLDGGTETTNPTSYTKADTFTLAAPTKEGYEFAGWKGTGVSGTKKTVTVKNATGDRTYTAIWVCKVNFVSEYNGKPLGTAPKDVTVHSGKTLTPSAPGNSKDYPTKGFAFDGWYLDKALTQEFTSKTPITQHTTLYAKWVDAYTLTFQLNGGNNVNTTLSVPKGDTVNLKMYKPTRSGYTFSGWYKESNFVNSITSVKMDKDTTVYAKWAKADSTNPKTGDSSAPGLAAAIAVLSATCLAGVVLTQHRKREL